MDKLIKPGRIVFAVGIIALGILQFFVGDFIIGRPPVADWAGSIPGKLAWAYLSGSFLIIAGVAIILNKKTGSAGFLIIILIFISSFLLRHLPQMIKANSFEGLLWQINAYKTLALCGGTFIVSASFLTKKRGQVSSFFTTEIPMTISCIFIALFFIVSGCAHFKFHDFIINSFIPAYIPAHAFWTYFCGIALIAAGAGILIKKTRKWAAALSGLMILLWFFLLHIPRAIAAPRDYSEWMGVFESFAFSGILFTLAGLSSERKF